MYTAYVLTDETREALLERFPPKYEKVIAHHITVEFGIPEDSELPPDAEIKVIGYIDNGTGLEALVVSVDGKNQRDDDVYYHITWSLDPDKFKPVDSGKMIGYGTYTLILSIPIETTPSRINVFTKAKQ